MSFSLTFHPDALLEYVAAITWYEEQKPGLGLSFETAVENKIQQIISNPLSYTTTKRSFREAGLNDFPFVIVYRTNEKNKTIYVSAIFHTKRFPKIKFRKPFSD